MRSPSRPSRSSANAIADDACWNPGIARANGLRAPSRTTTRRPSFERSMPMGCPPVTAIDRQLASPPPSCRTRSVAVESPDAPAITAAVTFDPGSSVSAVAVGASIGTCCVAPPSSRRQATTGRLPSDASHATTRPSAEKLGDTPGASKTLGKPVVARTTVNRCA